MNEPLRLVTEYGYQIDPSTRDLLELKWTYNEADDVAQQYRIGLSSYAGTPILTYAIHWSDDNPYRHTVVKRWLRKKITELKELA